MNSTLSLSGAILRAMAANGDKVAQGELVRRQAKRQASGKVTVAALRSWGRTAEAEARITSSKALKRVAAPKTLPLSKSIPAASYKPLTGAAFTRTNELVQNPTSATAHLHNRLCGVEVALLALAESAKLQDSVLRALAAKLLA